MSFFEVAVQRNNSETNQLNKNLTTLLTLTGSLKEGTSIIDPVILVSADLEDLKFANYLSITAFGRSYFIQNITSYRQGLVEIYCHVDVLTSFRVEIRRNKGIIFRQQNEWNLYLNDGVLEIYQNPIVTTHEFPNGFDSESYVMSLAGRPANELTYESGDVAPGGIPWSGIGTGSNGAKSCDGLAAYAEAQLGNPYWFGTFGQTANQALLDNRKSVYPSYYTKSAADYQQEFGHRVHDCVGMIKGYRWSETPTSTPVYEASQDVDVPGLFGQCTVWKGKLTDTDWAYYFFTKPGVCVFKQDLSHVGIAMGDGTVIEARGSAYGVVRTNIGERGWYYWGVPDWLIVNLATPPD